MITSCNQLTSSLWLEVWFFRHIQSIGIIIFKQNYQQRLLIFQGTRLLLMLPVFTLLLTSTCPDKKMSSNIVRYWLFINLRSCDVYITNFSIVEKENVFRHGLFRSCSLFNICIFESAMFYQLGLDTNYRILPFKILGKFHSLQMSFCELQRLFLFELTISRSLLTIFWRLVKRW